MSAKPAIIALVMSALTMGCESSAPHSADHQVDGTLHICSSCHGIAGNSVSPDFPILAAQQAAYIEAQLRAFRDHSRADPHAHTYMWGMAAHLDDATIAGVALYFSRQPPVTGSPATAQEIATGGAIFTQGLEARNIPACAGCHGDHGEGQADIPRLAGQHATYLGEQLRNFRSNARANETMHQNALPLTDGEIVALADYLSSL